MNTIASKKGQSIQQRAYTDRLQHGTDVCVLPTGTHGVVRARVTFPGGSARGAHMLLSRLRDELLLGSSRYHTRDTLREALALLGAEVHVTTGLIDTTVHIACRKPAFAETLHLVMQSVSSPLFLKNEFEEVRTRMQGYYTHMQEDTAVIAEGYALRAVYLKGHPHFVVDPRQAKDMIASTRQNQISRFHADTYSAIPSSVCVVGDIPKTSTISLLGQESTILPEKKPTLQPTIHLDSTRAPQTKKNIVPFPGKMNVDTCFVLPLSITRDHEDYPALDLATRIVGGDSTSRLFHVLRTQKSLTYGAYASLRGFGDGYPGYIMASAIFPHDVFGRGIKEMQNVLNEFFRYGVTPSEVRAIKDAMLGRLEVAQSTTAGMMDIVHGAVRTGKPLSYLDEYFNRIRALTATKVNKAIMRHCDTALGVYAAAGAVDEHGAPISL